MHYYLILIFLITIQDLKFNHYFFLFQNLLVVILIFINQYLSLTLTYSLFLPFICLKAIIVILLFNRIGFSMSITINQINLFRSKNHFEILVISLLFFV